MRTIKRTLCGLAVKGLASATVARPVNKATMTVIKKIPAMATATAKTNKYVGFGVAVASGIVGDIVVDKLIDEACGNDKHYKKGKKHHHKKKYHKNEHDTKKKKLEVKGLTEEKVEVETDEPNAEVAD